MIAAYTGMATTKKILFKMGKTEDEECRFCRSEDENMEHLLFECEAFKHTRTERLHGIDSLKSDNLNLNNLKHFLNQEEIFRVINSREQGEPE